MDSKQNKLCPNNEIYFKRDGNDTLQVKEISVTRF